MANLIIFSFSFLLSSVIKLRKKKVTIRCYRMIKCWQHTLVHKCLMLHIVDSNTKQFMFAASRILFPFIYHNNFFQSSGMKEQRILQRTARRNCLITFNPYHVGRNPFNRGYLHSTTGVGRTGKKKIKNKTEKFSLRREVIVLSRTPRTVV